MKKINLITLLLAVFTISVNAQFKVGLDYRIVANPLPVKKDGVVGRRIFLVWMWRLLFV